MKLEKDDITAMKQADHICFHLTKNEAHPRATASHCRITLIQEKSSDVFGRGERQRIIECVAGLPGFASKAFAMLYHYNNHGAWAALLKIVRPGDEIIVTARENGNQYVSAAIVPPNSIRLDCQGYSALHSDEMLVTIRRNDKDIVNELVIAHSTCPDNSARMIQS